MLTVYRADLPRTLTFDVALSLAAPTTSIVVREFHSPDPRITIPTKLDREPFEAATTANCREWRRELSIANSIDRIRNVE